jgi:tRNA threonylcarbamoyladenosine biosynthesis protein TsaB
VTTLRLLAIETSSATATIALAVGDAVAERTIATPREQTGRALGIIDELLVEAGLRLADLDALVFGQGPGSFTGLRVAAAIAQGLSLGSGRPIVPVSSLAGLAQRAFTEPAPAAVGIACVLCCVDARMGEVYSASFAQVDGLASPLAAESIGAPAAVRSPAAPYLAVGDGLLACREALESVVAGAVASDPGLFPRARDLLPLARGRVARGEFVPIEAALPLYLRESGAWGSS